MGRFTVPNINRYSNSLLPNTRYFEPARPSGHDCFVPAGSRQGTSIRIHRQVERGTHQSIPRYLSAMAPTCKQTTYPKLWLRTAINTKQAAQIQWHLVERSYFEQIQTGFKILHTADRSSEAKVNCQCHRLHSPPKRCLTHAVTAPLTRSQWWSFSCGDPAGN